MKDISGKAATVTGAASGIGLAIATALAEAGANVVMADIQKDEEAVRTLSRTDKRIIPVRSTSQSSNPSLMHWRKQSAHSASCMSPATMPTRRCTAPADRRAALRLGTCHRRQRLRTHSRHPPLPVGHILLRH